MIVPKIWKTQSLGSPGEKYSHLPKSWMYESLRKMEPVIITYKKYICAISDVHCIDIIFTSNVNIT